MKKQNTISKFDMLIESYINGNISWVREQAKKLTKEQRKEMYQYLTENFAHSENADKFFFSII